MTDQPRKHIDRDKLLRKQIIEIERIAVSSDGILRQTLMDAIQILRLAQGMIRDGRG